MADIAILVAEEYERRMKQRGDEASTEIGLVKNLSEYLSERIKNMFGDEGYDKKIESFKRRFEAKSQFGLAVSQGFFSA